MRWLSIVFHLLVQFGYFMPWFVLVLFGAFGSFLVLLGSVWFFVGSFWFFQEMKSGEVINHLSLKVTSNEKKTSHQIIIEVLDTM